MTHVALSGSDHDFPESELRPKHQPLHGSASPFFDLFLVG
jgi:hypothetical protein